MQEDDGMKLGEAAFLVGHAVFLSTFSLTIMYQLAQLLILLLINKYCYNQQGMTELVVHFKASYLCLFLLLLWSVPRFWLLVPNRGSKLHL